MTGEFPHYRVINGNGYWVPTPAMKRAGFQNVPLGKDGHAARAQALIWEQRWQEARKGLTRSEYATGTVGWAFVATRDLEDWKRSTPAKRQEWERSWKYIKPFFADLPPRKVTLVLLDKWYYLLLDKHGVDTAWRAMKTWRALYKFMASMHLCNRDQDPSVSIRRLPQNKREQYWTAGEIAQLIKGAVRLRMPALACIISIGWDTIFQPGDNRTLTRRELFRVGRDIIVDRGRIKNGNKVIGRLTVRSRRLLECYLKSLEFKLHPDAQIFRTRGYNSGAKGGATSRACTIQQEHLGQRLSNSPDIRFRAG